MDEFCSALSCGRFCFMGVSKVDCFNTGSAVTVHSAVVEAAATCVLSTEVGDADDDSTCCCVCDGDFVCADPVGDRVCSLRFFVLPTGVVGSDDTAATGVDTFVASETTGCDDSVPVTGCCCCFLALDLRRCGVAGTAASTPTEESTSACTYHRCYGIYSAIMIARMSYHGIRVTLFTHSNFH